MSPILSYGRLPAGAAGLSIEVGADGPAVIGAPAPGETWTKLTAACLGAGLFTALVLANTFHSRGEGFPVSSIVTLVIAWGLGGAYSCLLLLNRDLATVVAVREGRLVVVRPRLGRLRTEVFPAERLWGLRAITHGT